MILERLLGREERSTSTLREPADWLWDAFGATPSASGKSVNVDVSLTMISVFSAVRVIAETMGSLPLEVFRPLTLGRERATDSPLWPLLTMEPNDVMTAQECWEIVTGHLCLWGNAYLWKDRNPDGTLRALYPVRPSRVTVFRQTPTGPLQYRITIPESYAGADGPGAVVGTERDILHIRAFGTDGTIGMSPIHQARQGLGTILAEEEFAGRFYANNARPSGVLQTPSKLSPEGAERLKSSWDAAHRGLANSNRVAVLEDGVTWQTIGIPPADQQFLQQRQMSVADVARLFRIPPSLINAEKAGSMTYSTVEQENLYFTIHTIRPWAVRIEKALMRDGDIRAKMRGEELTAAFNLDDLQRGDTSSRYLNYSMAIKSGWKSPNEARIQEGENPVPGLDYYVYPVPPKSGDQAVDEGPKAPAVDPTLEGSQVQQETPTGA